MQRQRFLGMSNQGALQAAYTMDEEKVIAAHKVRGRQGDRCYDGPWLLCQYFLSSILHQRSINGYLETIKDSMSRRALPKNTHLAILAVGI